MANENRVLNITHLTQQPFKVLVGKFAEIPPQAITENNNTGQKGTKNETKGKEHLKCVSCNYTTDRDVSGSRNIFIKNIRLR